MKAEIAEKETKKIEDLLKKESYAVTASLKPRNSKRVLKLLYEDYISRRLIMNGLCYCPSL